MRVLVTRPVSVSRFVVNDASPAVLRSHTSIMPLLCTRWCTYNVYLDVPQLTQTHIKPIRENGTIPTKIKKKTLCGGMNAEGLVDANEALYQLSYSPLDVTLLRKATRNNIVRSAVKRNLTPKCRTRVDTVTFRCRRRGKSPTPLRMDTAAAPGNVITSPARPAPSFRCRTRTRCRPDRTARPRTRRRCGSPRRTPCRWWRRR